MLTSDYERLEHPLMSVANDCDLPHDPPTSIICRRPARSSLKPARSHRETATEVGRGNSNSCTDRALRAFSGFKSSIVHPFILGGIDGSSPDSEDLTLHADEANPMVEDARPSRHSMLIRYAESLIQRGFVLSPNVGIARECARLIHHPGFPRIPVRRPSRRLETSKHARARVQGCCTCSPQCIRTYSSLQSSSLQVLCAMSPIRTTAPELRLAEINDLALNTTLYYSADLSYVALDVGLSSALFGVLTLLVILAVIFLIHKGLSHTPVRVLLPSTLLLYGSAVLYMAALASHVSSVNELVAQAQAGLFSQAYTDAEVEAFERGVLKQSWMMTVALVTNVIIGDSIVWWRVCALWRHWIVYWTGPLLIVLTSVFGLKDLLGVHHCARSCRQPQMLLPAGVFADACASLSLGVNLLATALIGYKTWTHWQLLRQMFDRGRPNSRVIRALALLVESGTIYSVLLLVIVAYEASPALFAAPDVHQSLLLRIIADYTYACFIHVMAIYPVMIIVIFARDWSPIDHGFTDGTHVVDGDVRSSTSHVVFNRATVSTGTTVTTVTMHTPLVQGGEEGAFEVETKQDSLGI